MIDFPNSPIIGQQFSNGVQTWQWTGTQWNLVLTPGPTGPTGPTGQGVPTGGATNSILYKNSATNYDTAWSLITNAMLSTTAGGIGGASTSFAPTLYAGSTATTVSGTGSNRTGAYIQIGKMVFYWFNIQFSTVSGSSLNGGSGVWRISLPVAANQFPDSLMTMGTLRLTNVTVSSVANQMAYIHGPILDNTAVSGVWTANFRYSSAAPFGSDTVLASTGAVAQLNTANSTRFAGVMIYEAL